MSKKVSYFALTGFIGIALGVGVIGFGAGALTGSSLSNGPTSLSTASANKFLQKLTGKKAEVVKSFAGPSGLTGVVIKGSNGKLIGWMTNTKSAVIIGNVVDTKNKNLTIEAAKTELESTPKGKASALKRTPLNIANKALEQVSDASGSASNASDSRSISNGEGALKSFAESAENGSLFQVQQAGLDGPHKLYAFVDPNCIFCHDFYDYVQNHKKELMAKGVSVIYVPVAILKQSSINKAAEIAEKGWPALQYDESHFNVDSEEGGLTGLTGDPLIKYSQPIKTNTEWMNHLAQTNGAGSGTPFFVWQTATGRYYYLSGFPNGKGFASIFASMQNGWTPPSH